MPETRPTEVGVTRASSPPSAGSLGDPRRQTTADLLRGMLLTGLTRPALRSHGEEAPPAGADG